MDSALHRLQKKHLDALEMYTQLIQDATRHLAALMDMESTPELPVTSGLVVSASALPPAPVKTPEGVTTSPRASSPLLTTKEAAACLSLAKSTLEGWRCTGDVQLPFVKMGRTVRYRRADLDNYLDGKSPVGSTQTQETAP